MYDFGASVNDTIQLFYTTTIDSIDSVQLFNGQFRKRFWLNNEWSNEIWIEGIGSSRGILSSQDYLLECLSNLNCYKHHETLLYSGDYNTSIIGNCDSFLLSVADANFVDLKFELTPNPATDFLAINFSSPNFFSAEIKMTSILGMNLLTKEIERGKSLQIPVSQFSFNQILVCQLWKDGQLLAVKKVLIQK
jgi:hypothetical protein